jgi:hypothetical protein
MIMLANIQSVANDTRRQDLNLLLCPTPACMADHNAKRQKAIAEYQAGVNEYEPRISSPGEREIYRKFSADWAQYQEISDRANAMLAAGTIRRIQDETRETLQVMEDSRTAVETGMEETARARHSLEEITESSKEVEQQVYLIATAATEQTAASGEISESAGQISQLSVENSQGAEEAIESLKSLGELASQLDGTIRQFQFETDQQSGGRFAGHSQLADRTAFRTAHS